MDSPSHLDPKSLLSSLRVAELVLAPLARVLRQVLDQMPPEALATSQARDEVVSRLVPLLLAEVPSAALVRTSQAQRFVRHVLDGILDGLGAGAGPSDIKPQRPGTTEPSSQNDAVAPAGSAAPVPGLGVRSVTIEALPGVDDAILRAEVANVVPWTFQPLEALPGFHALRVPEERALTVSEAWELARTLEQLPGVRSAEPAIRQLPEVLRPDLDTGMVADAAAFKHFGMQDHKVPETVGEPEWPLEKTFARSIWASGRKGAGVLIGHVDTGYTQHPEILANIRRDLGFDTWDGDRDAQDDMDRSLWDMLRARFPVLTPGHGTSTASIIVSPEGLQASHQGPQHVVGTAPSAQLIPIRATPTVVIIPTGSQDEVSEGIMKAALQGAKVISMSLGSPWGSRDLRAAVHRALDMGVIVCAAAGNVVLAENWLTGVKYPAAYAGVVAVAGCDYHYRPWRDTCRGPEVVITAPATDVWRASASRNIEKMSTGQGCGTSFAVAHVAGVAACWINHWGGWNKLLEGLGGQPRRIPAAFLECLRRHQAIAINIPSLSDPPLPGYPTFRASDFGRGVIHVENLLDVNPFELPAPTDAPLDFAEAQAPEAIADLSRNLPEATKSDVRRLLQRGLGLDETGLARFLRDHGREFLHHVATSTTMRARLLAASTALRAPEADDATTVGRRHSLMASDPTASVGAQLMLRGSASLRADLLRRD